MKISTKDVEHVALLSRLELGAEELGKYAGELSVIFEYVEQLNEVDVTDVPPTAHPHPISNVFREDVVKPGLSNEQALANAPDREDSCFKVPKIV